jgi:hypothetical protein
MAGSNNLQHKTAHCRYLAELEMRLHLSAEDLDASLEDDCARALQRVPNAVQEVTHVKVEPTSASKSSECKVFPMHCAVLLSFANTRFIPVLCCVIPVLSTLPLPVLS